MEACRGPAPSKARGKSDICTAATELQPAWGWVSAQPSVHICPWIRLHGAERALRDSVVVEEGAGAGWVLQSLLCHPGIRPRRQVRPSSGPASPGRSLMAISAGPSVWPVFLLLNLLRELRQATSCCSASAGSGGAGVSVLDWLAVPTGALSKEGLVPVIPTTTFSFLHPISVSQLVHLDPLFQARNQVTLICVHKGLASAV